MTMTPVLTLNNGVTMPALGLGVFQSPPEETTAAVEAALRDGYRLIDTAAAYGNEREVGDAVRASGLDRSEVFLETKIWISDYGYDETLHALREERGQARRRADRPADPPPGAARRRSTAPSRPIGPWRRCWPTARSARSASATSWSITCPRCSSRAQVVPAVNQIEVHPYFAQPEVQAFGAEHGILTQAWSPIGGITFYRDGEHTSTLGGPRHRRDRRGARQEPRPGHAALGPPARTLGHPEVHQGPSGSPRTSTSSTSSSPPTS